MSALSDVELRSLLARGCACGRNHLRVRAIETATMDLLEGEAAGPLHFTFETARLDHRVYRVECDECRTVLWERDDCPRCGARGARSRAEGGRYGLEPPRACPRCEYPDLKLQAEVRMHCVYVNGHVSRRVADAQPHEPGFHVVSVECPSCDQVVASAPDSSCPVCGKSSLLKRAR